MRHKRVETLLQNAALLNSGHTYPLPLCTPTPKPILCFRPSILSLSTNNIDSGVGGFTVFK